MNTVFTHKDYIYKANVTEKQSEVFKYKYYDIDCQYGVSKIKHKKRLILGKMIEEGYLCEDIVLHILSFSCHKYSGRGGEFVTRNFLSDNFVKIIMMNENKIPLEKAKSLFFNTLTNGSKVIEEKAMNVFKCITYICYAPLCKEFLDGINFDKINTWGNLKLKVLNTIVVFYN